MVMLDQAGKLFHKLLPKQWHFTPGHENTPSQSRLRQGHRIAASVVCPGAAL